MSQEFFIISADGSRVGFDRTLIAAYSTVIKAALSKDEKETDVKMDRAATGASLKQIAEYINHHKNVEAPPPKKTPIDEKSDASALLDKWDYEFIQRCKTSDPFLVDLVNLADALQMDNLIEKVTLDLAISLRRTCGNDPQKMFEEYSKRVLGAAAKPA